jgi:hypothetical protein
VTRQRCRRTAMRSPGANGESTGSSTLLRARVRTIVRTGSARRPAGVGRASTVPARSRAPARGVEGTAMARRRQVCVSLRDDRPEEQGDASDAPLPMLVGRRRRLASPVASEAPRWPCGGWRARPGRAAP